jgi:molybdate transport system substrate-binding protein
VLALVLILVLGTFHASRADEPVLVAAAANLRPALPKLTELFTEMTGVRVETVFGSSGKLTSQILNGAPFEVFLSADQEYPGKLATMGLGADTPRTYAIGILVLCLRGQAKSPVAIANPATAPYGRAAIQYIREVWEKDPDEVDLVIGESIGQAAQFFASGNVDRAFLAKSQVLEFEFHRETGYRFLDLGAPEIDSIRQDLLLLKKDGGNPRPASAAFADFLLSKPARELLEAGGYRAP